MQGLSKGQSHILKIAIIVPPVQGDCSYILTSRGPNVKKPYVGTQTNRCCVVGMKMFGIVFSPTLPSSHLQ